MKSFKSIGRGLAMSLLLAAGFGFTQSAFAETAVWDGSMVRPSQGSGTAEDPFLINTAEEMAYLIMNYDYNLGIFYRKYYKLTRDLDMKSTQWTFGNATNDRKSFRAHFDGAGHKISNIEVSLQDNPMECHYGMFPQLGGDDEFESVIENLEIENIHFVRSTGDANGTYNFRIGGLVGQMYKRSRISNCIVHGFAVTDYGQDVNMRSTSRISACPLVGEIQHKFGDTETFHKERSIVIESCYGKGTSDLSHFHGREDQLFSTDIQGRAQFDGYSYNGINWYTIGEGDCSFSMTTVDVTPAMGGNKFQYEGYFNRQRGHTYTYRWLLDGKRIGTNTSAITTVEPKPYVQRLGLTVYDNGQEAGSGAILIEPDKYNITIEKISAGPKKNTFIVDTKMSTESGLEIAEDEFDYSWTDMTDGNKEVSTSTTLNNAQEGHTYMIMASHRVHKSAKFTLVQSFNNPIYVCNRGIDEFGASIYTMDGKTYAQGNDANDGLTPETAVRSLRRAYDLLSTTANGGSIGKNVIIIMGEYGDYDFSEWMDNRCTRRNPNYFVKDKPALITGRAGNFRNSRMLFAGLSIKLMADTRFEQINLHGSSFEIADPTDQAKVFACGNNLTMGYGILINGYKTMDYTLGMTEGVFVPTITLYGGLLNNNDPDYVHPENTITIYSGTYGRVVAGDGYTLQMDKTGNISGTPTNPVRTHVVCDAANYFDPYHSQYDVSLIIGGQGDGTIFADTKIDVKGSSRVGRIVGGNVAFGRAMPGRPADSFFGQTDVTISGGSVAEVFGTSLGRYGHILYPDELDHDSCVTYFYGRAKINVAGGMVLNALYGGGAADVVGFDYDGKNHSWDPHVPYWKDGKIAFGDYKDALKKMPIVQLREGALDLSKTELHINISEGSQIRCSVYGGSTSYSSLLPTRQAGSQSGCIFADTYINMTGGLIEGYIFGGCQGNLSYFENSDNSSYPIVNGKLTDKMFFTNMGQMYGNSHVNISGGEIHGVVFAGGEGTYYRATSDKDATNAVDRIGSIYGSATLNISGNAVLHDYAFGGGNYAHVLRTGAEEIPALSGTTEVNVSGGKLYGAVFGAGHGNKDAVDDARSIYARVDGNVRLNITGGEFVYNEADPHYVARRLYGFCGGGISTSTVKGNVNMSIQANPFTEDLKEARGINPEEDFIFCPGGYDKDCHVLGMTNVEVRAKNDLKIDKIHAGGIFGNVGSAKVDFLQGKVGFVYAGGRNGSVLGKSTINVGLENDEFKFNDNIEIESIFSTCENGGTIDGGKTKPEVKVNGGAVMNVF